jgi:hypothetical protein
MQTASLRGSTYVSMMVKLSVEEMALESAYQTALPTVRR